MTKQNHVRIIIIDDIKNIHDFIKILKIADDTEFHELDKSLFDDKKPKKIPLHFEIDTATKGIEGIALVKKALQRGKPYTLAFIDLHLPDLNGVETINRMWQLDKDIQVIINTSDTDYSLEEVRKHLKNTENLIILKKPIDATEVRQLVILLIIKWFSQKAYKHRIQKLQMRLNESSKEIDTSPSNEKLNLEKMQVSMLLVNNKLLQQMTHDPLTGFENQNAIIIHLNQIISELASDEIIAILCFGIDHFNQINDGLGHTAGNALLFKISEKLKSIPGFLAFARLEGDKFIAVLTTNQSKDYIMKKAEKIIKKLPSFIVINNHPIIITTRVGISIYPDHGKEANSLINNAIAALFFAKNEENTICKTYNDMISQHIIRFIALESELHHAIQHEEFRNYYRPILSFDHKNVCGIEIVPYWRHPKLGFISSQHLLRLANKTDLVTPIYNHLLINALKSLMQWFKNGIHRIKLSIYIPNEQFMKVEFINDIETILMESQFDSTLLEFEFSENLFTNHYPDVLHKMIELKNMGIHLVLDKFNMEYTHLNYLKQYPFEKIKVDCDLLYPADNQSHLIINTILTTLQERNLAVVVNNIKNYHQLDFLSKNYKNLHSYLFFKSLNEKQCLGLLRESQVILT